eukprot:5184855-Pyramimonas_sp.AAC.1
MASDWWFSPLGGRSLELLRRLAVMLQTDCTIDTLGRDIAPAMGLQREAQRDAQVIERARAAERSKSWRSRLKDASRGGAGYIHRLTKWATPPIAAQKNGLTTFQLEDPQMAADVEA